MDWLTAQNELSTSLAPLYGEREATVIADWVTEALSGKKKLERLGMRGVGLSTDELAELGRCKQELLAHRPVQYVLGESWFAGEKFFVDERVLIPRPETEELVDWAASAVSGTVLDVGTGSGCIAVTLARRLNGATAMACDVSGGALEVARRNAAALRAEVQFFELDFLDRGSWGALPPVDWVVSNPPYIRFSEEGEMARHVIDYEPNTALFVPNEDALVFYRALGEFARERGSGLFAEIHEERGSAVQQVLLGMGAREVELRKDLQGKDRMIKATW